MKTLSDLKLLTVRQMEGMVDDLAATGRIKFPSTTIQPCRVKFVRCEVILSFIVRGDGMYTAELLFAEPRTSIPYRFNLRRTAKFLGCEINVNRMGKAYERVWFVNLDPREVPAELMYFTIFFVLAGDGKPNIPWLKGIKAS